MQTNLHDDSGKSLKKADKVHFVERFRHEWEKDMQHRLQLHAKMNYSYLQYKGILYLNSVYGQDYLKSIGLQVNVPRTFMTIESIRAQLSNRDMRVDALAQNKAAIPYRNQAKITLESEWSRSKSNDSLSDVEFDALLFGTGYGLSKFVDRKITTDLIEDFDDDGNPVYEEGELTKYKGMKFSWLNPYYVFPDHTAITDTDGENGSWGHCYVYSMWDFQDWLDYCKANGWTTKGVEKGGLLQEFDGVRRRIDSLYSLAKNNSTRTRDDGKITNYQQSGEKSAVDTSNKIMVLERYEPNFYSVVSGANWTLNYKGKNTAADKRIPIGVVRDVRVPGEFDGIGEPEIMRWQQYQENKVENLSYMSVLMNTVQRYGIIEKDLVDPVEARMSNPFKPIRLKARPNADINKSLQTLNQKSVNSYPKDYLQRLKDIEQGATGITDFLISSNEAKTKTATEAEKLKDAANQRVRGKIMEMESRDLIPILEHWLANIANYYDEELDMRLSEDEEKFAKFLPITRDLNDDPEIVAYYASENNTLGEDVQTVEDVFIKAGYQDVVFLSDILNRFHLKIKTSSSFSERQAIIEQLDMVFKNMVEANNALVSQGLPPKFDIGKLGEDMLTQFPDIIKNPEEYIINNAPQGQTGVAEEPLPPPAP